jgi:hypothetical protein
MSTANRRATMLPASCIVGVTLKGDTTQHALCQTWTRSQPMWPEQGVGGREKGTNYRPNGEYENVRSTRTREENPSAKVSAGRAPSFIEPIGSVKFS